MLERLQEVPGVQSGALSGSLPGVSTPGTAFGIEGRVYPLEQDYPVSRFVPVSPGFFDLMGVEPVLGRAFNSMDRAGEQPVAIVNQSFARKHFPDQDPVGQRLRSGRSNSINPWRTIVGVVPDMIMQGISFVASDAGATGFDVRDGSGFYMPLAQTDNQSASLLIRSQGAPLELTDGVRDLVRSIDPDLAIFGVSTLATSIARSDWVARMIGGFYIVFGAAALFLASVGLFGVVSFGAERRTQEVGLRMAVGAQTRDVLGLIVSQGTKQMGLGLVVGVPMAAGLARVMEGVLFETEPWDPVVYAGIVGLILLVGVMASLVPALRAARLDPVRALRSQ